MADPVILPVIEPGQRSKLPDYGGAGWLGPLGDRVRSWAQDNPLDAATLAVSVVPVVGDVVGAANDVRHYWNEPESRTLPNYALTAAGLLPFVPPVGALAHAAPVLRGVGAGANRVQQGQLGRDALTYDPAADDPAQRAALAAWVQQILQDGAGP